MAWQNANATAVGGSGEVYTAVSGTAVSAVVTTPIAAYNGQGLLSEEGVSTTVTPTIQELNVWQSFDPIRRTTTAREILISFAMAQWDEQSVPLAFGGGSISGSGPYVYAFPAADASLEERAIIVDAKDGSETHRFSFARGNVTEAVATQWNRTSLALLPVGFKVLGPALGGSPGNYVTDATSFAAGS